MEINQGKKNLLDLARAAYNGEVVLPDFQRNFIWERQNIEEFLVSIIEKVFVGTFLVLETIKGKEPFKCIFIQGAKEVNPEIKMNPHTIILDGQQRLTALFYALFCPPLPLKNTERPYLFFIDLDKLANHKIDESVFSHQRDGRFIRQILNNNEFDINKLKENRIIPFKLLRNPLEFSEIWFKHFHEYFKPDISRKIKTYLDNIFNFEIITLSLPPEANSKPDNIVVLFERLNRTGIRLSTYDLLVARAYKFINLREEWEGLFKDSKNYHNIKRIAEYKADNTDIPFAFIQAIALSKDRSIKDRELIKLDEKVLNKRNWNIAVGRAENKVLKRLLDRNIYGIGEDVKKWIPYTTLLIPLLAFYLKYNHPDVNKIDQWYWTVVFSERYTGATETKIMKDFKDFVEWIKDDEKLPESVRELRDQIKKNSLSFKEIKRSGSSLYKGIMNLILKNNPLDFFESENISINDLNDHHIFPKSFLKDIDVDPDLVLNRTLILDSTNKIISGKSPADYIQEMIRRQMNNNIKREEAEQRVMALLNAHYINNELYEILKSADKNIYREKKKELFEKFIALREEIFIKETKKLVGYKDNFTNEKLSVELI